MNATALPPDCLLPFGACRPFRDPEGGCGGAVGRFEERGPHVRLTCTTCGKQQAWKRADDTLSEWVPKTEIGIAQRSTRSHPDIKPSQRARILERDGFTCYVCGRRPPEVKLHVGHILSVEDGEVVGASRDELFDDLNLVAMCEEENGGFGGRSLAPRAALRLILLLIRAGRKSEGRA